MSIEWSPSAHKVVGPRPYTGELHPLDAQDREYFYSQYELPTYWSTRCIKREGPPGDRYAMPIFGPDARKRGVVLRLPWKGAPRAGQRWEYALKADTYKDNPNDPLQSFYKPTNCDESYDHAHCIVLVEDQLSAIKLSAHGFSAVALLGKPTSSNRGAYSGYERVAEIARAARTREVIVALDADATADAFNFVRKWGSAFAHCRVAILSSDLKDTPAADFSRILGV